MAQSTIVSKVPPDAHASGNHNSWFRCESRSTETQLYNWLLLGGRRGRACARGLAGVTQGAVDDRVQVLGGDGPVHLFTVDKHGRRRGHTQAVALLPRGFDRVVVLRLDAGGQRSR